MRKSPWSPIGERGDFFCFCSEKVSQKLDRTFLKRWRTFSKSLWCFGKFSLTNLMMRLDAWADFPWRVFVFVKARFSSLLLHLFSILSANLQRDYKVLIFSEMKFQIICNSRKLSATCCFVLVLDWLILVADVAEWYQSICNIIYLRYRLLGECCRCVCRYG